LIIEGLKYVRIKFRERRHHTFNEKELKHYNLPLNRGHVWEIEDAWSPYTIKVINDVRK
jgi:hypothetical protein